LKFTHTLKFRLIVTTILCAAVVSLVGNLSLFNYLNGIIRQKADRIVDIHLSTLRSQLDKDLSDLTDLAILCASDTTLTTALEQRGTDSFAMRLALNAQNQLNTYLASSPLNNAVDVLAAFNADGLIIMASGRQFGSLSDYEALVALPLYQRVSALSPQPFYVIEPSPSIKNGRTTLAVLCPVQNVGSTPGYGYLYIELGLDVLEGVLAPYSDLNDLFVAAADGQLLTRTPDGYPDGFTAAGLQDGLCRIGASSYEVRSEPLCSGGLRLYHCVVQTALDQDGAHILYAVTAVIILSLLLAAVLAVMVSASLSRPISRLDERLRRIASNDFSFDPTIEKPQGELGQIGRTINEMSMSIQHLLRETEEMSTQRRNIEIELLQSQVNPHFLYNTLDSIRWMAVIQKNPGIANMTRSLSNLLKNIAKGTQDKIPLSEELSLLQDYIAIQSVRYLETFTFVNRVPRELYDYKIVKLTLQPLVENAIFHGIEPTGECGTITVSGREEGDVLCLTVEDNGVGIEPERLANLLSAGHDRGRSSLNGIGIANVHQRLQLIYGREYGLVVESEPGRYTRVTVRLPKEV